jgi:hypothetical protein
MVDNVDMNATNLLDLLNAYQGDDHKGDIIDPSGLIDWNATHLLDNDDFGPDAYRLVSGETILRTDIGWQVWS